MGRRQDGQGTHDEEQAGKEDEGSRIEVHEVVHAYAALRGG